MEIGLRFSEVFPMGVARSKEVSGVSFRDGRYDSIVKGKAPKSIRIT